MIQMKSRLKDIKRYLWDVLLFSGIGCFSYFLLVYYADIPSQYQDRLMTFQAFSAVVVLFNGVGLSVKYINEKLMMYYQFFLKNHRMLSIGLITAAIILFISNYLLLVSTKLLIESPHPFMLKDKGLYVMLTVWFIELIIVGQFMLNRFYVDLVKLYKRAEELEEKTVNPELGYIHSFFNFGERPLAEILTERLKIETSIDNDSRTMLYGENIKGVVKGVKNVLFINIGWGLGMGIMIDGKLYKGKSGFSGEIGHTYGYDNQIICHCGKKGCVETEVSCSALYRKFIEHLQAGETSIILSEKDIEEITLDDIFSAINREDLLAIELVEQIGQQLGFHIGSLINTFNPDMVIIGGEMSRAGDFLLQPVISAIRKYTLSLMSRDSEIVLSKLKDQACVIGSCLLSRSKLFEA